MVARGGVQEGMTVRSSDGDRLGKVVFCGNDSFLIEKGFFFPKDYTVSYDTVTNILDDEVCLSLSKEQLKSGQTHALTSDSTASERVDVSMPQTEFIDDTRSPSSISATQAPGEQWQRNEKLASSESRSDMSSLEANQNQVNLDQREEIRVPVLEEEAFAQKHMRETGEVKVHKEVVTEMKEIKVPVTREEIHVERVPVNDRSLDASSDAAAGAFQDTTIRVPVREEEIEITKRPVVKEEVRISKEAFQEVEQANTTLRKERVEVDSSGDLSKQDASRRPPTQERPSDILSP